jgi:hypothetical protein
VGDNNLVSETLRSDMVNAALKSVSWLQNQEIVRDEILKRELNDSAEIIIKNMQDFRKGKPANGNSEDVSNIYIPLKQALEGADTKDGSGKKDSDNLITAVSNMVFAMRTIAHERIIEKQANRDR